MKRSFERKPICRDIQFMQLRNSSRHLELGNGRISPVPQTLVIDTSFLLSNSENCEHLKNSRNADCVLANHNKVQDTKQTSKPQTNSRCFLQFSYLSPYWLISRNTITFHKYFWCSRFCEFHSNNFDNNEKILFIVNNVDPHIYRLTAAYLHSYMEHRQKLVL